MLIHEFIVLERERLPQEILYDMVKLKQYSDIVLIDDDYILNNHEHFVSKTADFKVYWNKIGNSKTGLAYYGITVFMPDMIEGFREYVFKTGDCADKDKLLKICATAIENGLCMVHFGI